MIRLKKLLKPTRMRKKILGKALVNTIQNTIHY